MRSRKPTLLLIFAAGFLVSSPCRAEQMGCHEVTDASGRIAPWYGTGPSQAYDHVIRLVFDFWKTCPSTSG